MLALGALGLADSPFQHCYLAGVSSVDSKRLLIEGTAEFHIFRGKSVLVFAASEVDYN